MHKGQANSHQQTSGGPTAILPGRSVVVVDLESIRQNVRQLRAKLSAPTEIWSVVKADGYGHGAFEAGSAAVEAGAAALVVVTADEALELRERGYPGRVLALGPFMEAQEMRSLAAAKVEIALAEEWGLELLALAATEIRAAGFVPPPAEATDRFRIHLKLESGMNRRGLAERELAQTLDRLETLRGVAVHGVMTHLARADEDEASVAAQLAEFDRLSGPVQRRWPAALRHTSNSAATLRHPEAHFDAVRVGVALYGLSPFQHDPEQDGLRPALSWHSTLTSVKQLVPGEAVGYGHSFRAEVPTKVGLVPLGYADGVRRELGGKGQVLVRGERRPMIGRVSMDSFAVDLGDAAAEPGDLVTLIGSQGEARITAEEVARWLNTINYEVTCSISPRRARRVFLNR